MEKEITKNRQATEMTLIKAVNDIIEESGFEGLGINAVAAKAKVSKMLIYRYFNSLDGLIAAYIQQNDYWINFDEELPDQAHLATFIKQIFKRQIMRLRENYTLKRLYRWELTTDNKFVKELRNKREEKGIWLVANSKACADADVPSMPVELNTLIQDESITSIWDVGGDMVGAKVLARYQPQVIRQDYRMLFVLNANRPQTASVEIAKNYFREIEAVTGLPIDGIINNTHMCTETRISDIEKGIVLAEKLSQRTGIPVVAHAVEKTIAQEQSLREQLGDRLLPIRIYMKKPWEI